MLRGTCLSCYRVYARALGGGSGSSPFASPKNESHVTTSSDGKKCVARSSTTVAAVPRGGGSCRVGCQRRPRPPGARQVVAAAAAAATAAVTANEFDRRRFLNSEGGVALDRGGSPALSAHHRISRAEGRGGAGDGGRRRWMSSTRTTAAAAPPIFGKAIPDRNFADKTLGQTISSDASGLADATTDRDREDCPICKKYSIGPCGDLFKQWLKCADDNPGKDARTGEDLHLSKCESFALPLARCLEDHDDYYSSEPVLSEEGTVDSNVRELRRAWSGLVDDLEHPKENRRTLSFPDDIKPEMQVRLRSMEGMAAFAPANEKGEELILAYIKDQDGELLGAGSSEDVRTTGGVMRFGVRDETREVTACALYGGEDGTPIYAKTQTLPRRGKEEGKK